MFRSNHQATGRRAGAPLALALGAGLLASTAMAAPPSASSENQRSRSADADAEVAVDAEAQPKSAPLPYRGTRFGLRTAVSALTAAPDAELTYNPYAALSFSFLGLWWFSEQIYFLGAIEAARELTHSDWTTYAGEIWMEDTQLELGANSFWTIPGVGVDVSAAAQLMLPTSKRSQGASLLFTTGAELSLSRRFDDLGPVVRFVDLSYILSGAKSFHQYTTASYSGPTIADCANSPLGCAPFLHSGVRNASGSVQNSLRGQVGFVDLVTLDVTLATLTGFLYPLTAVDGVSYAVENPVNERYLSYARFAAVVSPVPAVDLVLGASTLYPQLQPDGTYYAPIFNRYTHVFVDVRLNPAGVLRQLRDAGV